MISGILAVIYAQPPAKKFRVGEGRLQNNSVFCAFVHTVRSPALPQKRPALKCTSPTSADSVRPDAGTWKPPPPRGRTDARAPIRHLPHLAVLEHHHAGALWRKHSPSTGPGIRPRAMLCAVVPVSPTRGGRSWGERVSGGRGGGTKPFKSHPIQNSAKPSKSRPIFDTSSVHKDLEPRDTLRTHQRKK